MPSSGTKNYSERKQTEPNSSALILVASLQREQWDEIEVDFPLRNFHQKPLLSPRVQEVISSATRQDLEDIVKS